MRTRTQKEQIGEHLVTHRAITPMDALTKYGCMRLAARIYDLRHDGWLIDEKTISSRSARFARYTLVSEP